jgi:flagellar basal body L-ring protein FlgH
MKKLMLLAVALMFAGCAMSGAMPPSGATPGSIVGDVTYPGVNFNSTQYQFTRADFEIICPVTAEAESSSILGIIASGDSGYARLYEKAKAAGADDVICVKVDTHYYNIFAFYSRVSTKLHGIAIKWTKK